MSTHYIIYVNWCVHVQSAAKYTAIRLSVYSYQLAHIATISFVTHTQSIKSFKNKYTSRGYLCLAQNYEIPQFSLTDRNSYGFIITLI